MERHKMSTWAKDLSRTCQMMLELERKYWRDKRQVVYSFVSSITMEGRMNCRDNSIGCTLMNMNCVHFAKSMSLYLISDILQNYTSGFKKFPKKEQKLKVRKFFHQGLRSSQKRNRNWKCINFSTLGRSAIKSPI